MLHKITGLCVLLVGLVNAAPVIGAFGPVQLEGIYAIKFQDPEILLLMQHRAMLFGVIGGFALFSVWRTQHRFPALTLCAISMVGYMGLVFLKVPNSDTLWNIYRVDLISFAVLIVALVLEAVRRRKG